MTILDKLNKPEIITATYRIVTPMFIGDAQQKATGISPASVKGALRFWWRALNWGRVASACHSETEALKQLHEEEAVLFGSSAYDSENKQREIEHKPLIGASRFTLKLDTSEVSSTAKADWPKSGSDSGYLGWGLFKTDNISAREYLSEGKYFSIALYANKDALIFNQTKQLKDALLAWGLFGGLGSRSRRAFGSVAIEKIDTQSYNCKTVAEYKKIVQSLFQEYRLDNVAQPPFSALSRETEFSINNKLESEVRRAHSSLGASFKAYRGSKDSPVKGKVKVVFGLPYADGKNKEEKEGRRASPLLFHIHPIGTQFTTCALLLPATFHHDSNVSQVDYSKASNFLSFQNTVQDTVII